jgi:hypothetical protein
LLRDEIHRRTPENPQDLLLDIDIGGAKALQDRDQIVRASDASGMLPKRIQDGTDGQEDPLIPRDIQGLGGRAHNPIHDFLSRMDATVGRPGGAPLSQL